MPKMFSAACSIHRLFLTSPVGSDVRCFSRSYHHRQRASTGVVTLGTRWPKTNHCTRVLAFWIQRIRSDTVDRPACRLFAEAQMQVRDELRHGNDDGTRWNCL
jgi:hypothetical protein